MKAVRHQMVSFEQEDRCACGEEIIFLPPFPRHFWIVNGRKVCDRCGSMMVAVHDVAAVEVD